jgi:hypothetical protein
VEPVSEIDAARERAILASLAGFPFLLVFGIAWLAAGALSCVVAPDVAPWLYVFMGFPATPIAILLERRSGYLPASRPDPLLALTLQILFVQVVAFPVIMIVWSAAPHLVPVAFAAIAGAHFLPYQWIYRTKVYGILGVVVSLGSFLLAIALKRRALQATGFFVGASLLTGAFAVRSHAKATWLRRGSR